MDKHTQTIHRQQQSSQYQNWKANKYSILTIIRVSESSTRISKFCAIYLDHDIKCNKCQHYKMDKHT